MTTRTHPADALFWRPGDPLHDRDNYRGTYVDGVYDLRPEPENETCICSDAASWPDPTCANNLHNLGDGDELADLIAWHRRQREDGAA
jgi:hypothetical protein